MLNRIAADHDDGIVNGTPLSFRSEKPMFNLTFDLDGKTIGKFWYEDKQLKFEGDTDESAQVWVDWVIEKFMGWHDENIR
jgi:hypothetical protein